MASTLLAMSIVSRCCSDALGILRHQACSLLASVLLAHGSPAALFGACIGASGPGVVLLPVMDLARAGFAIDEADLDQRADERAFLAIEVDGQLQVLIGQSGQIAITAVGCHPQEQANQIPRASLPQPANELLGLWMAGQ
ncbi:hypothetical protein BI380_10275 [Delftia tsuruhatensis]|uniref:Uncharacterized protein n=1 Tax=Delftia tsuruhatensis TaxID=180282 RepID=A0ABM6E2T9_9BURK|nr:hypothetical protein BI380_10275 [Delftia tsuruhatensis]